VAREAVRSGPAGGRGPADAGQSTVEWIGLVLVASLAVLALATLAGARLPGLALAQAVADRLVCLAQLGGEACGRLPGDELEAAYGAEVAETVRSEAPTIAYEAGMRAVPVDFRSCREDPCSLAPAEGAVLASDRGEPVTLFVHVVDCRAGAGDRSERLGYDCSGDRAGNLYLQYWAYYPGSQSLRGLPGNPGYHPDDWESAQLRLSPGAADARASSHQGYNYRGGAGNWLSDAGIARRDVWGPAQGRYYVSGGSHAGHAWEPSGALGRWTPGRELNLVPLEEVARGRFANARFAVPPPWRKRVYRDPEYRGTD
jgi:hypothetical protein